MDVFDAFYDGTMNEVTIQPMGEAWPENETPDFSIVVEGLYTTFLTPAGEELKLVSETQTKEQGVILFASLLGLREAARE